MSDQALQIIEHNERPLTAVQVRAQVNLIQEVLQGVMKKETHYGVIPGTDKPTLYKAGAEKIMATFRLAAEPMVEDLSTPDCIRYRVKIRMVSPSGVVVGYGIGECSTNEEKYKWRKAYDNEFNATPEDRKRVKQGKYTTKQVRTEPADLANTVLKMAKKRALVDATLTTTAASDIFTQDIEDLPEELRDEIAGEDKPTSKPTGPGPYPQDQFLKNIAAWQAAIASGKKTPEQIIAMVSTKGVLSEEQKRQIRQVATQQTQTQEPATQARQPGVDDEWLDGFDGGEKQ